MQNSGETVRSISALVVLSVIGVVGCSSDDQRLVSLSRESADRQAEQNRLVETNNQQVIDAARELVEADAQGRKENLELHKQIESERSAINEQRDALEAERRQLADHRIRDPLIANAILAAAGLVAAILPLAVCVYLLRGLFHKSDDQAMVDVLIEEMVSHRPLLAAPEHLNLPANSHSSCHSPTVDEVPSSGEPPAGS
jgi:hypothetical protein